MQVFEVFDCDRSGTIDKKEIIEMIVATSALTCNAGEVQDARSLADRIMASCDVRQTGKITKTEFINGYIKCILLSYLTLLVHSSCKNVSKYCQVLVPGYDEGMFQYEYSFRDKYCSCSWSYERTRQ